MKKILLSVLSLGVVAAVAVFATQAYFSDTEKSEGNKFTAGKLDLRFQVGGGTVWSEVNGAPLFNGEVAFLGGGTNDLKPGDKDEKTVKLWVDDNPSCGRVSINVTEDKDNSCTTPELLDDPTCNIDQNTAGELNDQVNFAVWKDPDCNNILDGNETILVSGPLTGDKAYNIGAIPTGEGNAECYGIAYCFGTWSGTSCNGALVNNAAQTDSFKADIIIDAIQKRNLFDKGCPIGDLKTSGLENKDLSWNIIPNDGIYGTIIYSSGAVGFNGVVKGYHLVPNSKYQITFNGPGTCTTTDGYLAVAGSNAFQSGYWNVGPGLDSTCGSPGQGIYNLNLIGLYNGEYTVITDASGDFVYPFNLALQAGDYTGVKVLVKKTLDPFVSPWTDPALSVVHGTNLFETASISFKVI